MSNIKNNTSIFTFLSDWASGIIYTFSLLLYLTDHIIDFLIGVWLLDDLGVFILIAVFLPVIPTFLLSYMRRVYRRQIKKDVESDSELKHSLLGIDWFNQQNNCFSIKQGKCNIFLSIFFIIFRIDTLRTYCQLMRATKDKNNCEALLAETIKLGSIDAKFRKKFEAKLKKKKKVQRRWDHKLRADLFLIMVCETLPQCCLQIYICGRSEAVSVWQLTSVVFSIVDLVFNFTIFQIKRWNQIWRANLSSTKEGEFIEKIFNKEYFESLSEIIKKERTPPSISLTLKFKNKHNKYVLKDEELTARHKSDTFEHTFHYWVCVIVDVVGSPIFFITAFPTISLYSVSSGTVFMWLYLPVIFDFLVRFWWWNPETHRRNMNWAFNTLYLAYKCLLRTILMGLICIWFIKIMMHSDPTPTDIPEAVPSFVWPEPNKYLYAIANYNTTDAEQEWMNRCEHAPKNLTLFQMGNGDTVIQVYRFITDEDVCTSTIAIFVFCIIFYINIVGIAWEFFTYVLFILFNLITQSKRLVKGIKRRRDKTLPKDYHEDETIDLMKIVPSNDFDVVDTIPV